MINFEHETLKGKKPWWKDGPWRITQELPWLTQGSVRFIEEHIDRSHSVLEFGSGGSTVFFARRAKEVISFESGGPDRKTDTLAESNRWYKLLVEKLHGSKINNVQLYLLHAYPESELLYSYILGSLPDEHFHWILIDGAYRNLCIEHSKNKLISGGYMIIDNYGNWEHSELLHDWQSFPFDHASWKNSKGTLILQKP